MEMTIWREIEDDDSERWVVNPWPLAIVLSLTLWAAIFWAADMVVVIYGGR
jgi:hypothetical protein